MFCIVLSVPSNCIHTVDFPTPTPPPLWKHQKQCHSFWHTPHWEWKWLNVKKVCFLSSPIELSQVIRCAGSSVRCFVPDTELCFCHCHAYAYLVLSESVFVLCSFRVPVYLPCLLVHDISIREQTAWLAWKCKGLGTFEGVLRVFAFKSTSEGTLRFFFLSWVFRNIWLKTHFTWFFFVRCTTVVFEIPGTAYKFSPVLALTWGSLRHRPR